MEIEKILDQQKREIVEEITRHIDVIKEDFDDNVQMIAEQYDSIRETLDSHTKTLNSHTETLNYHTEMIAAMKGDIEIMKIDIGFIKSGLKKKVEVEEFQALEKRVAILEAKTFHNRH